MSCADSIPSPLHAEIQEVIIRCEEVGRHIETSQSKIQRAQLGVTDANKACNSRNTCKESHLSLTKVVEEIFAVDGNALLASGRKACREEFRETL